MNPLTVLRILFKRARLRSHEGWSRATLEAHQASALGELLAFARARSPYYARVLPVGVTSLPKLPVLTKQTLMGHFDEIVTDRTLRLADLEAFLKGPNVAERFRGRYEVATTSGSSGLRSIIPANDDEWTTVVASYARANEWAGIRVSPLHPSTLAVVSSRSPLHQSTRVGRTVSTPFLAVNRLDAGQPLEQIVASLNQEQPAILVAYASMLRVLAEEQRAGRLRIAPRVVNCSSEVLTRETRHEATNAWGVEPFEVYAATETGGIGAECDQHRGLHLFEDLVLLETVDDDYQPVPVGEAGSRTLVTVLWSRTLPLIRYELTDRVRLSPERCPCGRTFGLIAGIEGRTDDVVRLPKADGGRVLLHPVVFHQALDLLPGSGWQVRQERDRLRVLLAGDVPAPQVAAAQEQLRKALQQAGVAELPLEVELVSTIPAGASGKRPLVLALKEH